MNATPPIPALSAAEIHAALRNYGLDDAKIKLEVQQTGLTPAKLLERIVDVQLSLAAYQANRRGYMGASPSARNANTAAPAPTAPSAAPVPAPAPSRPARTSAEMEERIEKIVRSHWAEGRNALAVQLCLADCSIEEALGVLKVSRGEPSKPAAAETAEAIAARIVSAGKSPDAAEIYSRRRKGASADHAAGNRVLGASEIYARLAAQRRTTDA